MKWTSSLGKTAIIGAAAIWLAGCASNGPASAPGGPMNGSAATPGTSASGASTQGVNDPAVMAVIKSGQIKGSPQQIAQLLKRRTYHYQTNQYTVTPADHPSLDATAILMQTPLMKNRQLVIEGNTDERGTRSYNMALGLRRANAVEQYLSIKGVPVQQMRVISYGFEKPLDPDHNSIAWAKNRRVHLVLKNMQPEHQ